MEKIFVVLLLSFLDAKSEHILFAMPQTVKSTTVQIVPIIEGLLHQGHTVTSIISAETNIHHPNYTEVSVYSHADELYIIYASKVLEGKAGPDMTSWRSILSILEDGLLTNAKPITESMIAYEFMDRWPQDNPQVDLLIVQAYMGSVLYYLSDILNCPLVVFSLEGPQVGLQWTMGNPDNPNWQVSNYAPLTEPFSMTDRIFNAWNRMVVLGYQRVQQYVFQQLLFKKYGKDIPYLWDLEDRVSLMLSSSHFITHGPSPLAPNTIEVSGLHLRKSNISNIPYNIQRTLDSAMEGAVYVSFGGTVKPSMMPKKKLDVFLKAFELIKIPVIWKINSSDISEKLPLNVMTVDWAPQQDILGHPNTKVFLTHGGLLSIQEALYHKVPIVGIPLWFDQRPNMMRAKKHGYAIQLEIDNIDYQSLFYAMHEALTDEVMRENLEHASTLFTDRKNENVAETAIWWLNYVMRHKGTQFLKPYSTQQYFWQYLGLDIFVLLLCLNYVFYCFVKILLALRVFPLKFKVD